MDDRTAGLTLFVASTGLFAYYTVWVLVTPFVELGHPVRALTSPHARIPTLSPPARPSAYSVPD